MSFGTVISRSQVTLEIFLSHANFCRVTQLTRDGRAQVVGRSLIGPKASQVSRRSVASVSRRSGRGLGSGARVYADRLVCQSLPEIDVNASLRSGDESLTTAHKSKKSRFFQLVSRS